VTHTKIMEATMKKTGVVCPQCGRKTDESPCWNCNYEFPDQEEKQTNVSNQKKCPECNGQGKRRNYARVSVGWDSCLNCHGTGKVEK